MIRTLLFTFFVALSVKGFAQREAANWYFGQNAGLTFNSGAPLPLLDGELVSVEGSATISDPDGNLLFYTEGTTLWNKNHNVMPNGTELKGSPSGSQTALIVPNPVNPDIYYVFTTDDALLSNSGEFNGFNYSVVDMSQDNGNGDVIEKNTNLLPVGSEKVTGVLNFTNNFYWVITHFEDRFYAYRVDGNGVDPNPTISVVGPTVTNFANGRGSLKISPDATKIAMTYLIVQPRYDDSLYVFDFDANTGAVTNAIEAVDHNRAYYGLEFSSNSKKLYASGVNFNANNFLEDIEVVQFDLETPNFFANERVLLNFSGYGNVFVAGALQMGLDKRIYHTLPNTRLSVIKNPNRDGGLTRASKQVVDLGGRQATFGLPPFVQSFFQTIFTIENFCLGETTTFTPEDTSDISSISWDFGDPNSGADNTLNALTGEHVFSSAGQFTVTVNVTYSNAAVRQFIEQVEIFEAPDVVPQVDLVQCDIDGLDDGITTFNLSEALPIFSNGNANLSTTFFSLEIDALLDKNQIQTNSYTNTVPNESIFARVVEGSECFSIVEITLVAQPMSNLGLYDTLYVCDGTLTENTVTANLSNIVAQLSQDFSDSNISLYREEQDALYESTPLPQNNYVFNGFDRPVLYFRVEDESDCSFIGSVELIILEEPDYEESVTAYLCDGNLDITALEGYENYLWSNGTFEAATTVYGPGMYDVAFGTGTCTYVQTFEVLPTPDIQIEEIVVDDFTRSNTIQIDAYENVEQLELLYSIDNGLTFQQSNTFSNVSPGVYSVVVDNGCTTFQKEVVVGGIQRFFTPNQDNFNDLWSLSNPEFFPGAELSIYDRYGKLLKVMNGDNSGWDGTFRDRQMPSDNYWYHLKLANGRIVKGFFALKR